jgi:hypothetical protein
MASTTTTARRDSVLLALASIVPVLPYVFVLAKHAVPRFDLVGDLAWMEYDTRRVWTADTLTGLSSRFYWSHPGPLFFWIAAPFEAVCGASGLHLAAAAVSSAAAATTVGVSRAFGGRVHAIAALLLVTAWFASYGNVAMNPWVRTVVVLPLLAYIVLASVFARGGVAVAVPAVLFGAIASQTHVSTVPTVGAVGVVSLVSFFVGARRRGGTTSRERRHLLSAASLLALTCVPPLIEQACATGHGNLRRLAEFFLHRTEPYKSLSVALRDWVMAVSWLPERVALASLPHDDAIAFAMRWDEVPPTLSPAGVAIGTMYVAALIAAAIVARRRRDTTSLSLLCFAALGDIFSILAVRAIIGDVHYSLLFWTTAPTCAGWIGIASTFAGVIAERIPMRRGWTTLTVALGLSIVGTTVLQASWLARFPYAPASYPFDDVSRSEVYTALREQSRRDGLAPVVHLDGAWTIAVSMILEYDRDGAGVYIGERERWAFPGGRSANGAPHVRHVWFADSWTPVPATIARCMQVLIEAKNITVLTSQSDVTSCDR